MLEILKIFVAIMTAITGVPSLVAPKAVLGFTGLATPGVRGVSEVRAILGGLLIGLGVAPFILGTPEAFRMLGIAYIAIAIARTFSIVYDKSYASSNIISLIVEIVFGAILVL